MVERPQRQLGAVKQLAVGEIPHGNETFVPRRAAGADDPLGVGREPQVVDPTRMSLLRVRCQVWVH